MYAFSRNAIKTPTEQCMMNADFHHLCFGHSDSRRFSQATGEHFPRAHIVVVIARKKFGNPQITIFPIISRAQSRIFGHAF